MSSDLIKDTKVLIRVVHVCSSTVHGLPTDTPTWVRLYDISSDLGTLIVDASIHQKWEAGAEILVTSATRKWDDDQVRRISKVTPHSQEQQLVSLTLDSPLIDRPTTTLDSSDFAVEVALLSRNIVFQGGYDSNVVHGAHFWVMHTPTVQQMIEGVEFVNFGQQGVLGRCVFSPCGAAFPLTLSFLLDTE